MKKTLIFLSIAALMTVPAFGQEPFQAGPYVRLQGGAAYDVGEGSFTDLLSPAAQVTVGYQFTPLLGARLGVSGWQARNAAASGDLYRFHFVQPAVDLTVDLGTLLAGWKADRTFAPYAFVGGGAAFGFDNDEAADLQRTFKGAFNGLWDGVSTHWAARAGLGADFRLGERVALNLELGANMLDDRFNSKIDKGRFNPDWHINALVGISIRLGRKAAHAAPAVVAAAAAVPQVAPTATPVVTPVVTPVSETAAETVREPVNEPADEVVAEPADEVADEPEAVHYDAFFTINSSFIRDSQKPALDALADVLKADPEATVLLSGYADKETGTPAVNMRVSTRRVQAVKDYLVGKGIAASRIETKAYGDTVQPYEGVLNRTVISVPR